MTILFVINQLGGGGAERVLTLLANQLSKLNDYEIKILSIHHSKQKYEIDSKVDVEELDGLGGDTFKIIREIRNKIVNIRPTTVVSFEYHMNMKVILATFSIKNVNVVISERNDPNSKGGSFPLKQIRNILYRRTDYLICQTPDAKSYFPNAIQEKTIIIPNPIKESIPEPFKGIRKKEIVNFCRLERQKNLPLLIDSFVEFSKEFRDFKMFIYGDGALKDELVQYITDIGMKDKIFLYSAVADIHERVREAYMYVSSSNYEGLSNSMLEAMALGLPTICTDCPCGGARMVIQDGINGLLVPVNDKNAMTNAMKRVASDRALSIKLSTNAVNIRDKLQLSLIVDAWRRVID